jgi:hypothetical protein
MTIYGDVVSIAATTAGVSGTITVPLGARLIGMNLAATGTVGVGITSVEVKWPGLQSPIKFVPNLLVMSTTNGAAIATCKTPFIDLSRLPPVVQTNTVTITITTTGNETVEVGLMWVAA